jgi:hypothetical protein
MIEYKVIEAYDINALQGKLNLFTNEGWMLWCPPFSHQELEWDDDKHETFTAHKLIAVFRRDASYKGYETFDDAEWSGTVDV